MNYKSWSISSIVTITVAVTLKDPIERGLKARLPGTLNSVLTVKLKDPIERGLDGKIKK